MGAKFTNIHDWTFAVYFLNINFFICIILAWIFYKADVAPMKTKFQFDWRGWLIIILFFTVILFLCTEGQIRNWFSDAKISIAVASLVVLIGIYLLHVRFTKDPIIDPDVYKHKNVVIGVILFFYIGVINSTGSIVTGFMGNILGFDSVYSATTHLALFAGILLSIPLSTYLLYKKIFLATIWTLGFAFYGLYHIILFFRFYPEIEPADFFVPLLFKGLGMGFLFPASLLYISEGIPKHLSGSRMMSGVISQTVLATLLGGAILSTVLSNTNVQHKTGLSQQLSAVNKQAGRQLNQTKNYYLSIGQSQAEAQKNAEKSLSNKTSRDAMLVTYKDIYLVMAAVSFFPILIILLFKLGQRPFDRVIIEPIPI
jgi:DHA2 family multidrug resistance protein